MTRAVQYVLLGTFCLGLLTFIVTFISGSNWKSNIVGKYILYFMVTMFGLFIYILLGPILGDYYGRIIVNYIFLLLINYGAWKLVWLLYKIQKNGEIKDDKNIWKR